MSITLASYPHPGLPLTPSLSTPPIHEVHWPSFSPSRASVSSQLRAPAFAVHSTNTCFSGCLGSSPNSCIIQGSAPPVICPRPPPPEASLSPSFQSILPHSRVTPPPSSSAPQHPRLSLECLLSASHSLECELCDSGDLDLCVCCDIPTGQSSAHSRGSINVC